MIGIHAVFRRHPDLEPSGKLSILGEARCSAEHIEAYARRRNPKAPEWAELYLRCGSNYGIRGDVAYCQMLYETRAWTRKLSGPPWAPFTMEQWGGETGVNALMKMLFDFATERKVPSAEPEGQPNVPDEKSAWSGRMTCWEDLSGKWAGSGLYGQDIVAVWRGMMEWKGKGESPMDAQSKRDQALDSAPSSVRGADGRGVDWSSLSTKEMSWLREKKLMPNPTPHPDRRVTWSELAALLYRWEKGASGE